MRTDGRMLIVARATRCRTFDFASEAVPRMINIKRTLISSRTRRLVRTLGVACAIFIASLFIEIHGGWGKLTIVGFGHGMVGGQYTRDDWAPARIAARFIAPWHEPPYLWPMYEFAARFRYLVIPVWMPALLIGAMACIRWKRQGREDPGRCATCGYDLRALKHPRCPECGAAFAS